MKRNTQGFERTVSARHRALSTQPARSGQGSKERKSPGHMPLDALTRESEEDLDGSACEEE